LAEEHHLTMTVARKQSLAQDVVELELRAAAGDALPKWEPGAHIDVHSRGYRAAVFVVRRSG
jgi:ferredoxin-NADP reductase